MKDWHAFSASDLVHLFTKPEGNRTLGDSTANSPRAPWCYRGVFMEPEQSDHHHCVVEYRAQ